MFVNNLQILTEQLFKLEQNKPVDARNVATDDTTGAQPDMTNEQMFPPGGLSVAATECDGMWQLQSLVTSRVIALVLLLATTISLLKLQFLLAHTYQSPSSDHDIIGSLAAVASSKVAIKTCHKRAADVLLSLDQNLVRLINNK